MSTEWTNLHLHPAFCGDQKRRVERKPQDLISWIITILKVDRIIQDHGKARLTDSSN